MKTKRIELSPGRGRLEACGTAGRDACATLAADALVCSGAEECALLCRAVPAALVASGVMMYMPAGRHLIRPSQNGKAVEVEVLADAAGAGELERQRAALMARGTRPFFDFNHEDREASYWPEAFFWQEQPEPGIYCRGEWTTAGKVGVEGKQWRQFSPVFHVDSIRAKPARIVCNESACANMGGLVNKPAFRAILPLFAKEGGDVAPDGAELRELQARVQRLTAETNELLQRG